MISSKTDLLVSLDMDYISFYQPLPQKPQSTILIFLVFMGNKLNNATFPEISISKFVKPLDIGS